MFGKVLTAMITPFDDKNEVDYKRALELAQYLVDNGSDGLVLCGTTGESPVLSDEEKLLLFSTIKKGLKGKVAVIAGTGSNSTSQSMEFSMKAVETGVDGIMLITPYYNKPPQQGLIEHFSIIADTVPNTPVMLYNVPSRTGVSLAAESVITLAKKKANIVALKEAGGTINDIDQVIKNTGSDFTLYSGNDEETLSILALGGKGVVSVASHIAGKKIRKMIDLFNQGGENEAVLIHRELLPLFEVLFISTNPMPVKAALKLLGLDRGRHRLPLVELEREKCLLVEKVLRDEGLL